jgi:23S rRNA (uracil1939-C5)-methyltransferase
MAVDGNEIAIVRLGVQGDGIAETGEGPRYVPFALPGEQVRQAGRGLPQVLSGTSAERRAPVCRHFGICGGCVAQHMSEALYAQWKRGIVLHAFRQHGLEPSIGPLLSIAPGTRRRAVLGAQCQGTRVTLGYHRRRSHDLVGIDECPVLQPAIVAALPGLRAVIQVLALDEARVTVLATPAGLDVAVAGGPRRLGPAAASKLASIAAAHHMARICVDGEMLVEQRTPSLQIISAAVVPPPGAFVQAVAAAEVAMAAAVVEGVGKAKRVADLFSGVGPFAFALASRAQVLAVDSDALAIATLQTAERRVQGLKPIATKVRDLYGEPLTAQELECFDAVVLDPPRAGARAQCAALARSKVPSAIYVSCDPATLARDAAVLCRAGYGIESVTPIDQFLFSAHVESVAVLRRARC